MPTKRNRRILFTSGVGLAQRVAQLLSTLVTLPLLLHALGVSGFGVWSAATSLAWLSGVLDFGLGSALLTLIPDSMAKGEASRIPRFVGASLLCSAIMSTLLLGGGAVLVFLGICHMPSPPFVIAFVALSANIPASICRNLWFGLHKGYIAGFWDFIQTALTLILIVAAAIYGANTTTLVAVVYGAMLLINTASLGHALALHPELRPRWRVGYDTIRTVLTRGSLMLAITITASCAYALDNLMALTWLGPAASAQMGIVLRVCTTAIGLLDIITLPLWPAFVEAIGKKDHAWLRRTLCNGVLGSTVLALMGSLVIVLCGAPVLRWWLHNDLHMSQPLLWAMAAWVVVVNLPRIPGLLLNAASSLRSQIFILTIAAIGGFALKFLAAAHFGVMGILGATPVIWLCLVTPAYLALAWRLVHRQGLESRP